MSAFHIGIVGCGNIAGSYVRDIKTNPNLEIAGFYDMDTSRSGRFAAEHGGKAYAKLDDMLADDGVDGVLNITIFDAHYDVTRQALLADKHVYSEKPLALASLDAHQLLRLAEERGMTLACAPITFLGEAQQTAAKWIREGRLGAVRLVYAEVDHGRIETWHPNPVPFYEVGPLWDVGVYPLTIATAFLGPARRVRASTSTLLADRVTLSGQRFVPGAPDYYNAHIELENGAVVRLTCNFYVATRSKGSEGMAFHGDKGSLSLSGWFGADEQVEFAAYGEAYAPVEPVRAATSGLDWSRGLEDWAASIRTKTPGRVTGAHAAHIVDILRAVADSARSGRPVDVTSSFPAPAPMPWAA